jgi:hypothetical protein
VSAHACAVRAHARARTLTPLPALFSYDHPTDDIIDAINRQLHGERPRVPLPHPPFAQYQMKAAGVAAPADE